ncbi:MAG: mechanosensitive ion channel domain-containing protein [Cyanobacteria bacterium P01_F01_bin.42]
MNAQADAPLISKSDVVVDGQVIFQLREIGEFSSDQRAQVANDALKAALEEKPVEPPIDVSILNQDDITSIRVDDRHVLSITDRDLLIGTSAQYQANQWATQIRNTLETAQWQRDPRYLRSILWQLVLAAALTAASYALLRWNRNRYWRQWSHQGAQLSFLQRLTLPLFLFLEVFIWLGLLLFICERFPRARSRRYEFFHFLRESFTNEILTFSDESYSLINVFELLIWAVAIWLLIRGAIALLRARFLKTLIPDRGLQDAISTLLQFSLTGLGLFILLQAWGINLTSLTIVASFLGVGLGFGLQNIFNNFISGWILLIERPVKVGDFINLGDLMGTVERIGSRSTEIRTLDRVSIIVPNSELVVSRVMNWNHRRSVTRLHVPLSIAYGSPIKNFHHAAIEAALSHPEILRYPQPQVRFLALGDSSLDFDLMVWIRNPRKQFDIKSDLYYLLETNLRRYDIEIPFPQQDVHVHVPNLSSMIDTWRTTDQEPQVSENGSVKLAPQNLLNEVRPYSAILSNSESEVEAELESLVEQMKGSNGLEIEDRRFRATLYPRCFIGQEAVTWIVRTQKATHEEALRLGQMLVKKGIIHHVTDEHAFKDDYLFYRFYEDES